MRARLHGRSLETDLAGDNRPAMNASFRARNYGSDASEGTRATRRFQCVVDRHHAPIGVIQQWLDQGPTLSTK